MAPPDEQPGQAPSRAKGPPAGRVTDGTPTTARARELVSVLAASSGAGPRTDSERIAGAPGHDAHDAHATGLAAFAASDTGEDAAHILRDVVGRAPLPSLSGLCFEIMGLAWFLGVTLGLTILSMLFDDLSLVSQAVGPLFTIPNLAEDVEVLAIAIPIVLIALRIAAGLGTIASDGVGQGSGANAWRAWKLGKRDTVAALGIAVQICGMMTTATLVLLTPLVFFASVVGKDTLGLFGVVLSGLALAFMLVYGAALGALQELSMASLVRHHRGVGSAILHGWRLMRARPRSSQRMAAAEFASRILVVGVAIGMGRAAGWAWGVAMLVLFGALVGGLRCHAWSMAYPRIGGLARVAD
ncbi:hypothetical protein Poly30_34130 [Planctomycetes bacterium Poly30]|uniref:Uncharacterized protein n=1 Tax=Saltatorellus ferox TaxID=2528018 RepID=A0A518EUW8_9BACT|nr:hypothetical protein Poly30_34130 [Planctomycetes bacterium Poly30]